MYWRVTLVDGGLLALLGLFSSGSLKVWRTGDFAGAVLDLARTVFETSGDGARNTGVPVRIDGVVRPVAGNNDSRADGGFDTVGEVALR